MASRGIKPGTIYIDSFSDEGRAAAYAASGSHTLKWSLFNPYWKLAAVSKSQCIQLNLAHLSKYSNFYSDIKCAMLQMNMVNHELTHLMEAHGPIHGILLGIVKQYYPHTNLNNHAQFINLQKTHELIAETVRLMLSLPSALLEETQNYPAPSNIHPSSTDLKPWIQRIITCYENYYGTIPTSNKLTFFKSLQ
jgi:hypothetical protein